MHQQTHQCAFGPVLAANHPGADTGRGVGAGGAGGATAPPNIQMFCIATIYTSPIQPPPPPNNYDPHTPLTDLGGRGRGLGVYYQPPIYGFIMLTGTIIIQQ